MAGKLSVRNALIGDGPPSSSGKPHVQFERRTEADPPRLCVFPRTDSPASGKAGHMAKGGRLVDGTTGKPAHANML